MKKLFKIATPISQLFENEKLGEDIIQISDLLEIRDKSIKIKRNNAFIYHSELNILTKWSYREIKKLEKIKNNYQIRFISYHLASRYQKNIIKNDTFIGVGKAFSITEMKNNIRDNVRTSIEIFGHDIPILVENMNHLLTDAYDIITEAGFIREIIEENNLFLLLDIPHAKITAHNLNLDFEEYFMQLPLERCKQIHISGYSIKNGKAFDTHSEVQEADWIILKEFINMIKNLEYITVEYYKDEKKLINQLKKLKEIQFDFIFKNILQIAEWDSEFFGFKVANLNSAEVNDMLLNKCMEKAKEENIKCIYCMCEPDKEELLKSVGFIKIDEKIELAHDVNNLENLEDMEIEEATLDDVEDIKKISSKAFRGISRFYKDPHFQPEKIDKLYAKWIPKLINDPDATILIIRENNKIIAFNGISLKGGEGRIELIAVDEKSKKKGYGQALIKQAYNYFNKINLEKKKIKIEGERIYLRTLTVEDVSERYYSWINDPEVTRFLETNNATLDDLIQYVKIRYNDPTCLFFGIFLKKNDEHIGNVKLEPIDFKARTARLGLLIGEKEYWNKGYETETYKILEEYAFKNLKLIEIYTGVYKEDINDVKYLKQSGFDIYKEDYNVYKMRIMVATQNRNIAAKKLYKKMGFVNKDKKYWFHWWNENVKDGKTCY